MYTEIAEVIRNGYVEGLDRMLTADTALVYARVDGARTLLHIATDWPGHFPRVRETITALVRHGADVNARFTGQHSETPLHWAASSDDIEALDALLDLGSDIEAPGAVIGGGTPLADAVAFAQWKAARRLVERGASTTFWQAAALGLMDRLEVYFNADPAPGRDEITNAFWSACHGGQLAAANLLLERGASLNWVGYNGMTPLDAAVRNGNEELITWLRSAGAVANK
jgi:ankyrin repeat protein